MMRRAAPLKILPDLILLDGGEPQVNAVLPVIRQMNVDVPVFGMVKDSKHRTRAIAYNGGEIEINSHRAAFTLVSNMQEEVHRFAVIYHQKSTRSQRFPQACYRLRHRRGKGEGALKHFKTIKKIKECSRGGIRGLSVNFTQKRAGYFQFLP
jgi:excinuclease ABC subunit C